MSPQDAEAIKSVLSLAVTLGPAGPLILVVALVAWFEIRVRPALMTRVERDVAISRAIAKKLGVLEPDVQVAQREEAAGLPLTDA